METFIQQTLNGLMLGSIYALVAIGYTLTFGLLRLLNFAHGEIYMAVFFFVIIASNWLGLPLVLALVVGLFGGVALGCVVYLTAFRFVDRRFEMAPLVSTIGLALILQTVIINEFGSQTRPFPLRLEDVTFSVGPLVVSTIQVATLLLGIVTMIGLSYVVRRTRLGRAMRAISEKERAALLLGVNVRQVILWALILAAALAALATVITGVRYQAGSPLMGTEIGLLALVIIVLGGLGNVEGAMGGALIVGLLEVYMAGYFTTAWLDAIIWGALIVVLLFRPSGLFGSPMQMDARA